MSDPEPTMYERVDNLELSNDELVTQVRRLSETVATQLNALNAAAEENKKAHAKFNVIADQLKNALDASALTKLEAAHTTHEEDMKKFVELAKETNVKLATLGTQFVTEIENKMTTLAAAAAAGAPVTVAFGTMPSVAAPTTTAPSTSLPDPVIKLLNINMFSNADHLQDVFRDRRVNRQVKVDSGVSASEQLNQFVKNKKLQDEKNKAYDETAIEFVHVIMQILFNETGSKKVDKSTDADFLTAPSYMAY